MNALQVPYEQADDLKKQFKVWAGSEALRLGLGRRSGVPARYRQARSVVALPRLYGQTRMHTDAVAYTNADAEQEQSHAQM